MIKGAWIEGEQLETPGPKFIQQLADLLVELHSMPHGPNFATYDDIPESNMRNIGFLFEYALLYRFSTFQAHCRVRRYYFQDEFDSRGTQLL